MGDTSTQGHINGSMNPKAMIAAWALWAPHACRQAGQDMSYTVLYCTILSMTGGPDYRAELRFLLCNGDREEYVWNSGESLSYLQVYSSPVFIVNWQSNASNHSLPRASLPGA